MGAFLLQSGRPSQGTKRPDCTHCRLLTVSFVAPSQGQRYTIECGFALGGGAGAAGAYQRGRDLPSWIASEWTANAPANHQRGSRYLR